MSTNKNNSGSATRQWLQRPGQKILYPFTRFGFGERFFSFRAGLFTLVILHFFAWGITKAVFGPQEMIYGFLEPDTKEQTKQKEQDESQEIDPAVKELIEQLNEDAENAEQQQQMNPLAPQPEEMEQAKERKKPLTPLQKLNKEKAKFRQRFLTLYIFTGIYFAFLLWHRSKYKARLAPDSYDYSRESFFDGYSWSFMWWLAKYTRRYLLYAKYSVKKTVLYVFRLCEYLGYHVNQKMQRKKDAPPQHLALAEQNTAKQPEQENDKSVEVYKAIPQFNFSLIEMYSYAERAHLSEYQVLECIVEPLMLLILGWVQIQFGQWLGYYFVFAGSFLAFFTYLTYVAARNYTLDKIDELFRLFREKRYLRYRKNALAQHGYRFRAPMPNDAEILENLAPHVGKKKERFVVT
ncbi:MAG: hypothetical protein MUC87_06955 [Bacteroidia bacterium]|jgi:hypothetical protein|nr:hypothetical protein [Bacteroidia bacterium]